MPADPQALGPLAALRASWRLFADRPAATAALGAAVGVSLLAACCGLGLLTAPWFMCELAALQLRGARGARIEYGRAWLTAGALQLVAALTLAAVGAMTLLASGADVLVGGASYGAEASAVWRALTLLCAGGAAAIALTVHLQFGPALLLDRGGDLPGALLESARVVREAGAVRTWWTSGLAHLLQFAPPSACVAWVIERGDPSSAPLWMLGILPVLALTIPLGQGMITASYLHLRDRFIDPTRVPPEARLSRLGAALWVALLLALASGPALVAAGLTRPSPLREGRAASGGTLLLDLPAAPAGRHALPDSALTLDLSPDRLRVIASDGGGAGTLPLPDHAAPLTRLRVRRDGSVYTLELDAGGATYVAQVDEAGVRQHDSLFDRARALLPRWARWLLAGCLLWGTLWMSRALSAQAAVRARLASAPRPHSAVALCELRGRLRAGALRSALWLTPAAAASVYLGLSALRG